MIAVSEEHGVQVSLRDFDFHFFGYVPRSEIVGSRAVLLVVFEEPP